MAATDPRVVVVTTTSDVDGTAMCVVDVSWRDDTSALLEDSRAVPAARVVEALQSDSAQQRSTLSDVVMHVEPASQLPSPLGQHSSAMGMQPLPHGFKPCVAQDWLVVPQVSPVGQQPYVPLSKGTQYCHIGQ